MERFDGKTGPKVGIFSDGTDWSMPLVDFAVAVEERGFTALTLNEHPHIPLNSPRSQFPTGGPIPERYARYYCPYTALAFVAARTSLEVGPSVSLIAEHDPIALAKSIATLDSLSGGRLLLGIGWGWNREEFEAQGFPSNVRAQVMEEKLMLMKALWTNDVASYKGQFVNLAPSMSWPKPASKPHPPVFGGIPRGPRNYKRLARWADGWIPMGYPASEEFGYERCKRELAQELEAVGRDPATFRVISLHADLSPSSIAQALEHAHKFGNERILMRVKELSTKEALDTLDSIAKSVAKVLF